jgi:hypothetical protein
MAKAKADAPKKKAPTGKRKEALAKLKHLEDGIATVQATVGTYLRDVQDLRALIEGDEKA